MSRGAIAALLAILMLIAILLAWLFIPLVWEGWEATSTTPYSTMPSGGVGPVKSYVMVVDGNAKLFINGKPVDIIGFHATSEKLEYIDKTAKYGVTFCIIPMGWRWMDRISRKFAEENPGFRSELKEFAQEGRLREAIRRLPPFELPEDAGELLEFAELDSLLDYAAQRGVYIIIAFKYFSPPIWWIKNFPDQLQTNSTGGLAYMPTFNSPAHLKYAAQAIKAIVERYKDHPALLGWALSFGWTSEDNYPGAGYYYSWGIYDYSPVAIHRFREWLRREYNGDVEALRSAWGNSTVSFDNAVPPRPLPPPEGLAELVEFINGPGDARRQWYDWMRFRLEEKTECMMFFAKLYKELDPNHVLIQTPANLLAGTSGLNSAIFLSIDPWSYVKAPIDIVYTNPGLNEKAFQRLKLLGYPPFLKYFELHGKAAYIKWEGRPGVDYDAHPEIIKTVAMMARKTGTGLVIWGGHVPMSGTWEEQPEFTDEQISLFIETFRSTPEGGFSKAELAVIVDPKLCFFTYYSFRTYKMLDVAGLLALFNMAGIDYDILPVDEVKENPGVLADYKAVVLDNIYRMDEELLDILLDYRDAGGGLFIVGKTGAYGEYGGEKYVYLQRLLGISSPISEHKAVNYSWTFSSIDDPLLRGIAGACGDDYSRYNMLYIPVFNYTEEGFTVLGVLDGNPDVATVGRRGNLVFWFPRLGLQLLDGSDPDVITTFLRNLCEFFGIHATSNVMDRPGSSSSTSITSWVVDPLSCFECLMALPTVQLRFPVLN